jgi:hypothetical protein
MKLKTLLAVAVVGLFTACMQQELLTFNIRLQQM